MSDTPTRRLRRPSERTVESRQVARERNKDPPVVLPGTLRRDPDGALRTAGGRVRVVSSRGK